MRRKAFIWNILQVGTRISRSLNNVVLLVIDVLNKNLYS